MLDFASLSLPELATLLQAAYAADHGLPGEHLTDRITRADLAWLLSQDEARRAAVVEAWLEAHEALEDVALYWLDTEFLAEAELEGIEYEED